MSLVETSRYSRVSRRREGSVLVLDGVPVDGEDPEVLLLELGTGEALEVPVSNFHDDALFRYRDSCLLPDWFGEWLATGGASPAFTECIGYKRPLFLRGQDDTSNLEVIDVYWSVTGQLLAATRHLPDGTPVSHLGLTS